MTPDRKESLMEKIQKLFNQAESEGRIGNQAAAETFAAKANQLLIDHNLSKGEVNGFEASEKDPIMQTSEEDRIAYGLSKSDGTWEEDLIGVLCRHNMCGLVYQTWQRTATIIGKAENIEVVKYMYSVLRRIIKDMSGPAYSTYAKAIKDKYPGYGQKELERARAISYRMPWIRSYLKGAVQGVRNKLYSDQQAAEPKTRERVDALMVISSNDIEKFKKETYGKLGTRGSFSPSQASGYNQGRRDGQGISVARGVSSGQRPPTKKLGV